MKVYNFRRVHVGEYKKLSDGTYNVKFNDETRLQDYKVSSLEDLNESLELRDLTKEVELGQLNIFDF